MSGLPQLSSPHPNPLPGGEGAGPCMVVASNVDLSAARPQLAAADVGGVAALSGLPQLSSSHPNPLPGGEGAGQCIAAASNIGLSAARPQFAVAGVVDAAAMNRVDLQLSNPLLGEEGAGPCMAVASNVDLSAAKTHQAPRSAPINPLSLRERAGVRANRPTPVLTNSPLSILPIFGDRP
jgi:hypothetical protein